MKRSPKEPATGRYIKLVIVRGDGSRSEAVAKEPHINDLTLRLYRAVQAFRNLPQLGKLQKLRRTPEYSELCRAWEAIDDVIDPEPDDDGGDGDGDPFDSRRALMPTIVEEAD